MICDLTCLTMRCLKVNCACNAICDLIYNCCLTVSREDLRADETNETEVIIKCAFFCLNSRFFSDLKSAIFKVNLMCNAICHAVENCCLVADEENLRVDKKDEAEVMIKDAFFCLFL